MTGKPKILVVEDDPSSIDFLRTLLRSSGYQVEEAGDGAQALDLMRANKPDLVMSDILMPTMDGFEMAQKIRGEPGLSDVPIVFYSATYNENQARWLAHACGGSVKLDKPAEPDVILQTIQKALSSTARPLKADPYLLAEEHTRLLSSKIAAKISELRDTQCVLEAEIEQRKRTEAVLVASENRYRSLVEDLPVGTFVCSLQQDRFMTVNPAMLRILGYESLAELMQVSISRDVYRNAEEYENATSQLRVQGIMIGQEAAWKRKDGSPILVRVSSRYANGDRVEGIAEDITWQRELETQLRQNQKLESLGRLAGGVAHDFNNLLMAIGGYTDLLLSKLEPETKVRRYAEQIKKATLRSADLTRQLLAFSRKQVLPAVTVDVNAVVSDLSNMLQHLLGPGITISISTGTRPIYVAIDRSQLEQVLMNLIVNARDAMPHGGSVQLEVVDTKISEPGTLPAGRYVRLSVTDSGQGIAKELQQKIFEPFFSTKGEQGTGLGLATVYGIVKQAKGEIRVESEPGHGARFTVLLPVAAVPAVQPLQARPEAEVAGGHERILLVDDEEALRLSMQEYLEAKGYSVTIARNGGEAMEIFAGHDHVEMLVTDLTMPGVSGADLARKVWETNPGFPVLFISGHMDRDAHEFVSMRHSGSDCIQKPFPLTELAVRVRSLLDGVPKRRPEAFLEAAQGKRSN